jgi:cytochrome P450
MSDLTEHAPRTATARSPVAQAPLFFNPRDPDFTRYPYPHYQRLRQSDPLHRSPWGVWFVGKYDHVRFVLKDKRFRSQDVPAQLRRKNDMLKTRQVAANQPKDLDDLIANTENWFSFLEGAAHGRLRKLVLHAFQRRHIDQMRIRIRQCVDDLLNDLEQLGEFDLMSDFAEPLPQRMVGHLLGVPAEDVSRCAAWADRIGRIFDPLMPLDEYARINQCSGEFMDYLRRLIDERRSAPQEDLVSALISAHDEEDRLTETEIVSTLILMFTAGEETVTGLIGNGSLALMRHPEQRQLMLDEPELAANAVEELLRYDSPFQMTSRTALEDVELGGKMIRKGDQLYVLLASANRDPEQFEDPDRLDLKRPRPHHMSFADGAHFCVGAQLAKIEAQEAFISLFRRFPAMRLSPQEFSYRTSTALRCLNALHVSVRKA